MNKTIKWLLFLSTILTMASCGSDDVTLYPEPAERPHEPFSYTFYVLGDDGSDLVRAGWLRENDVYAVYRGQKYALNVDFNTKFNENVTLHGLHVMLKKDDTGRYGLTFGELDKATDYKDETLTLMWSDGSQDLLRFTKTRQWDARKGEWIFTENMIFNGVQQPAEMVTRKGYLTTREYPDGLMVPMEWLLNGAELENNTMTIPASGGTYVLKCDNYSEFTTVTVVPESPWLGVTEIDNLLVLVAQPMDAGSEKSRTCVLSVNYRGCMSNIYIEQKR